MTPLDWAALLRTAAARGLFPPQFWQLSVAEWRALAGAVTAPGLAGSSRMDAAVVCEPFLVLADLPAIPGVRRAQSRLAMTAACDPWPGPLAIEVDRSGGRSDAARWDGRGQIDRPGIVGHLLGPVTPAPPGRWDCGTVLEVALVSGAFSSGPDDAVFDGGNLLAVKTAHNGWDVLQFAQAELVGPGRYQLRRLLWGQTVKPRGPLAVGAPCFILEERVSVLPMRAGEWGAELRVRAALADRNAPEPVLARYTASEELQPSPVHVQCSRAAGQVTLRWQRASTGDPDDWTNGSALLSGFPERYRILARDPSGHPVLEAEIDQPGFQLSADRIEGLQSVGAAYIDLTIQQLGPDGRAGQACAGRLDL